MKGQCNGLYTVHLIGAPLYVCNCMYPVFAQHFVSHLNALKGIEIGLILV